jgi:hypothetical protein
LTGGSTAGLTRPARTRRWRWRYAVETLRNVAESRRLALEAELPEDLPLINGDPIRLRQMIGNLRTPLSTHPPAAAPGSRHCPRRIK